MLVSITATWWLCGKRGQMRLSKQWKYFLRHGLCSELPQIHHYMVEGRKWKGSDSLKMVWTPERWIYGVNRDRTCHVLLQQQRVSVGQWLVHWAHKLQVKDFFFIVVVNSVRQAKLDARRPSWPKYECPNELFLFNRHKMTGKIQYWDKVAVIKGWLLDCVGCYAGLDCYLLSLLCTKYHCVCVCVCSMTRALTTVPLRSRCLSWEDRSV